MNYRRHDIVCAIAQLAKRKRYLELGLYDAVHLVEVAGYVQQAVGVDPNPGLAAEIPPNCEIVYDYTDGFFASTVYEPDLIFIDADHSYGSVRKDLENTLRIMTEDAIIILHDTDPEYEMYLHPGHCNDAHRIVNDLDDFGLQYVVLPIEEPGMTIACRKDARRVLKFVGR